MVGLQTQCAPFALDAGQPLQLRIYLDRSIVEVFVGDRLCLTKRIYPARTDSVGVRFFAHGPEARLNRLDAWQMGACRYTCY